MSIANTENQLQVYIDCFQKQLDEIDMLSSIFCNPGEIHIYDPGVISDFTEFIKGSTILPKIQLDFSIFLQHEGTKIDTHVSLPHLYPILENARITLRTNLIIKAKEVPIKSEIEGFISTVDKTEGYVYQVISWIQDSLERFLSKNTADVSQSENSSQSRQEELVEFERLWIYSHHIKSKTKRQEIVRSANDLNLTGFSRPGKPGVICVEGLKENTQEFWKIIKAMQWQKITIRRSEIKKKLLSELDKCRRFLSFKEELFTDIGDVDNAPMDMSLFMKYLDIHKSSYIKKDLFGFE